MKRLLAATAALVIAASASGAVFAAPNGDDHHGGDNHGQQMGGHPGGGHSGWKRGGHIARDDWNRGQPVDYHAHHLRSPPHGYEWRQVDGNYVLAAVATGVIASILLANQ